MKAAKTIFGILSITAAMAVQVQAQTFLTNGLVAYYPFNGNANDASGNGLNATVQGDYQYLSDGTLQLIGDGSLFYSGGGYVALPSYGNLNSGFTVSLWVKGETDHGNSVMAEYYLWLDNDANPSSVIYIGQYDLSVESANGTANEDFPYSVSNWAQFGASWQQLLLAYSPTNCTAYLNGIKIGSTNITVNAWPMVNAAIGHHWWNQPGDANSSSRMTFDVKDFRIYNRALSASEVQQLYAIEYGPIVSLIKSVRPSFSNLTLTTNYQLQVSTDLVNWTNSGSSFTATNSSMVYPQYFDVPNWNQLFFRLH